MKYFCFQFRAGKLERSPHSNMVLQLVVHPQILCLPVVHEVWSSIRVDRERGDRVNLCMLPAWKGWRLLIRAQA